MSTLTTSGVGTRHRTETEKLYHCSLVIQSSRQIFPESWEEYLGSRFMLIRAHNSRIARYIKASSACAYRVSRFIYKPYINIHILYLGLSCIGIPKRDVHFKMLETIFHIKENSWGCLSRCCSTGKLDVNGESSGAVCTLSAFGGEYNRLELLW